MYNTKRTGVDNIKSYTLISEKTIDESIFMMKQIHSVDTLFITELTEQYIDAFQTSDKLSKLADL